MNDLPQSFMIYKEELRKEKLIKEKLEREFELKLSELRNELSFLKEKLTAQETMMETMADYALKIENQLDNLIDRVDRGGDESYH